MAVIRSRSIKYLDEVLHTGRLLYAFRSVSNFETHLFLDATSARDMHELLDGDPLISHCSLVIEPLLTGTEMAGALQDYLREEILRAEDWVGLEFTRTPLDPDGTYFLARKVVRPFSPLLSIEDQNRIHRNTLISQRAHTDSREVADFNPVGKAVGILIMRAESEEEVRSHVSGCEVYVDSAVTIDRVLTLKQAQESNMALLATLMRGEFVGASN